MNLLLLVYIILLMAIGKNIQDDKVLFDLDHLHYNQY
jgi:hypothetical protein